MMEPGGSNTEQLPRWMEVIIGVVCILSVLGSLAIILTYAFVKDIRSKTRELLVHISLMDLVYTTANLVGLAIPYYKCLQHNRDNTNVSCAAHYDAYLNICKIQAFITVYGTVGSVLWTLGLAVYLYYRIVSRDATVTRRLVKILYIVCYMLPLYVSLWLLLVDHVGYPHNALSRGGWCFVDNSSTIEILMTYDIWIWLGIIILIPLYVTIHIHTRHELKKVKIHYLMIQNPSGIIKIERKLLLIPLGFIFLRIWDIADDMLIVYVPHHDLNETARNWIKLLTAIGDCGQGFFNFIIFFLFQSRLRALVIRIICCYCCCSNRLFRRPSFLHIEGDYDDDDNDRNDELLREPNDITFSQHTPR